MQYGLVNILLQMCEDKSSSILNAKSIQTRYMYYSKSNVLQSCSYDQVVELPYHTVADIQECVYCSMIRRVTCSHDNKMLVTIVTITICTRDNINL